MSRRPLNSLHKLTASLDQIVHKGPVLAVQSHDAIPNSDAFRIVCSHNPGAFAEADYQGSLNRAFDHKFTLVAGTVREVLPGHQPVVSMIVVPNYESKSYDDESVKGMHVVRANVFMDDSDNMWKVVGEGEGRRLVQMSDDNLAEILASKRARNVVHASYSPNMEVHNGDYVFYYDPKANEVRAGFGLHVEGNLTVLDRESGESRQIVEAQVVDSLIIETLKDKDGKPVGKEHSLGVPRHQATANFDGGMATEYLTYSRKLYSGTRFFSELEKWVAKKKGDAITDMRKD